MWGRRHGCGRVRLDGRDERLGRVVDLSVWVDRVLTVKVWLVVVDRLRLLLLLLGVCWPTRVEDFLGSERTLARGRRGRGRASLKRFDSLLRPRIVFA